MNLKKPLWAEGLNSETESASSSSSSSTTPVGELVSSLNKQRIYREVTLALRTGLRDASAEFSFLRVRGLRNLLKFLRSVAESESAIRLFSHSQSVRELQVLPVLFENSFKQSKDDPIPNLDHIFSVEPMKITSPSTDTEIALALRVLEGCCLLHRGSTASAHQFNAIKVLMNILSTRGVLERGACLDAFISIMLDSSTNQMDFEACRGIDKVAKLMKDKQADEDIRLKCGEFLLLFIGHINSRERPPKLRVHEDIRRLLGERSASLIWAASQFGSTLDPEQRQTALHIQARRVLESLEMY
ncbi:Cell division protein Cdc14 [Macleaya cordata]|uniref:Cell division protein Cdc14 n=1 Tax=Macleaya cordata TaxID=56857 RepID=A0A200Q777_MACCD|nr:Cell division protein Cdc14 [Macleaya cordata]